MSAQTQQCTNVPSFALTPSLVTTAPANLATDSCLMAKPVKISTNVPAPLLFVAKSARTLSGHITANVLRGTSVKQMDTPVVRTAALPLTCCTVIATTSAI